MGEQEVGGARLRGGLHRARLRWRGAVRLARHQHDAGGEQQRRRRDYVDERRRGAMGSECGADFAGHPDRWVREMNNNKIVSTIEGYFEDMYLSLKEMANVLKPGGQIGLVISNVRFAGVMIPVDELLGEIGEQVGLKMEGIYVLRYRGNSSQQMLRHKREPSRESLIVWKSAKDETKAKNNYPA